MLHFSERLVASTSTFVCHQPLSLRPHTTRNIMSLCDVCQRFDIRELLLKSEAQKTEATGMLGRTRVDPDDFRPSIPHFYKHLDSIVPLKNSSEAGCALCGLFWLTWFKTLNKPDFTDEWLDRTFEGQLYLGSSSWTTSGQGFPYITLIQQSSSGASRTLGSFEAFANRGEGAKSSDCCPTLMTSGR